MTWNKFGRLNGIHFFLPQNLMITFMTSFTWKYNYILRKRVEINLVFQGRQKADRVKEQSIQSK